MRAPCLRLRVQLLGGGELPMTQDPEADVDMPSRAKPRSRKCQETTQVLHTHNRAHALEVLTNPKHFVLCNFQANTRAGPHATKLEPLQTLERQSRGRFVLRCLTLKFALRAVKKRCALCDCDASSEAGPRAKDRRNSSRPRCKESKADVGNLCNTISLTFTSWV